MTIHDLLMILVMTAGYFVGTVLLDAYKRRK